MSETRKKTRTVRAQKPFDDGAEERLRRMNTIHAEGTINKPALFALSGGPGVKFCVNVFRQSQEWRWKAGRILA